jgi:transcriptional regulator with XRE-family HTH domain
MKLQSMPLRNRIKAFVNSKGITRYQFCKDTGLTQNTGYRLYNDSNYIPGSDALLKICKAYKIQPGVLIEYVSEDDSGNHEAITEQEASEEPRVPSQSPTLALHRFVPESSPYLPAT